MKRRQLNISKTRWSQLIEKDPDHMYDPSINIESGMVLIDRLRSRIHKPTPEKIGTLWNSLRKESVSDFGRYVGQVYREKPWKKVD